MKYVCLLFCLLLTACAAPGFAVYMPSLLTAKNYTIWYTKEQTTLPLLAGIETQNQKTELGLVFLQGRRFAKCSYAQNTLTCSLAPAVQSAHMQELANTIAQLMAHILANGNPLPQGWIRENTLKKDTSTPHIFTNIYHNASIRIEENI